MRLQIAGCEECKAKSGNRSCIKYSRPKQHSSKVRHQDGELKQEANPLILDALLFVLKRSCKGDDKVDELIEEYARSMDQELGCRHQAEHIVFVQPEFPEVGVLFVLKGVDQCQSHENFDLE